MYLNCHSWFSFLYGTLKPEKLLQQAKWCGADRLVLTDINNTSACIETSRLAKERFDIEVIFGVDFRDQGKQLFVAIAKNQNGFEQINRLLSRYLKEDIFPEQCPHLSDVFVIYPFQEDKDFSCLSADEYIGVKPEQLKFLHRERYQSLLTKMVLFHSVSFHPDDYDLHRVLRCVDHNTIISKLPDDCAQPTEVLLTEEEFHQKYQAYPELLIHTAKLLYACEPIDFKLGTHKNKSVVDVHPDKEQALKNDYKRLRKLTYEGAVYRYKKLNEVVKERIEKELKLIKEMKFVSYFLINYDIISFAQKRKFYYVGRGSGANSVVAYCLKITDVDPIALDLYFERFINLFRKTPPDFDIDFSWQDRDEVTAYILNKYGADYSCLQATYTTFQFSSIFRELGKVFGLPTEEIVQFAEQVKNGFEPHEKQEKFYYDIYQFASKLKDFPRNLSIHAGGILISDEPIYRYTATSHPPKGFPICQFDMYGAEDLGLYKFDILSQRGLGHIKDTLAIVKQNRGVEIDIHDIPKFMKDEKIVKHLEKGNLVGCFYVESPAMRMLLAKLECKDYLTLVAASSIIRPGVAQSGMMREYILRHHLPDKGKSIAHSVLWDLMEDTYGVMVYQEDVIKVAYHFAGLSLGESDVLRRGMSGKYRSREEFQKVRNQFFENCTKMGRNLELTVEVWRQIESFAGYSFAKGHSASFAVESYQSMYLKAYFPLDFMVGVINNFGGFYRTGLYVHEAKKAGAQVEAPCLNQSEWLTSIRGNVIFLGFIHVKGLESRVIENALRERVSHGFFWSLHNFVDRVDVGLEQLIILIRIGAFRFTGKSKQALLWDAHFLMNKKPSQTIQNRLFKSPSQSNFDIPDLHHDERNDLLDELELLEFTISSPFKLVAQQTIRGILAREIPENLGKEIEIMGQLVTTKPTRTKKGETMFFGTFLDRQGDWIDTVLFPDVAAKSSLKGFWGCYLIRGRVTKEFNFFTVEVTAIEKLGWWNAMYAEDDMKSGINQPVG